MGGSVSGVHKRIVPEQCNREANHGPQPNPTQGYLSWRAPGLQETERQQTTEGVFESLRTPALISSAALVLQVILAACKATPGTASAGVVDLKAAPEVDETKSI